jgi:basic amino acid/polyamine antiporter, APA family
MNDSVKKIGLITCISVIVSSMVGVGVYTSLGYQVIGLHSPLAIIGLWVFGGIMALCGALTYGELAVRYPRSGGEYNFLSEIYHPSIGFISGWISSTVGFAGPTAAAALVFADYYNMVFETNLNASLIATLLIVGITVLNILSFKVGSSVQRIITIVNITLMCAIVIFGIFHEPTPGFKFTATSADFNEFTSDSFGESLVYVSFAFSGWNAITYIINDVDKPNINVPKSLIFASLIVMVLYVLLNFVFLYTTPVAMIMGEKHAGYIAGSQIFGSFGGKLVASIICIALIASINSYTLAGPRVIKTIGEDFNSIKKLAQINDSGSPVLATMIQSGIAVTICWVSKFQSIINYLGLTLSILTVLTVFGVFVSRYKQKNEIEGYKTLGYPIVPIIFILIELFMIQKIVIKWPDETIWMVATVASGLLIYYLLEDKKLFDGKNRAS